MNSVNRRKTIKWVKVASHVTVEGNNTVDRLADLGRLSSLPPPRFGDRFSPTRADSLPIRSGCQV